MELRTSEAGGAGSEQDEARKGSRSLAIADRRGLPSRFIECHAARSHLVHATLAQRFVKPFLDASHRRQRLRVGQTGC
jgi:hypothetical protein